MATRAPGGPGLLAARRRSASARVHRGGWQLAGAQLFDKTAARPCRSWPWRSVCCKTTTVATQASKRWRWSRRWCRRVRELWRRTGRATSGEDRPTAAPLLLSLADPLAPSNLLVAPPISFSPSLSLALPGWRLALLTSRCPGFSTLFLAPLSSPALLVSFSLPSPLMRLAKLDGRFFMAAPCCSLLCSDRSQRARDIRAGTATVSSNLTGPCLPGRRSCHFRRRARRTTSIMNPEGRGSGCRELRSDTLPAPCS